MWVQPVRWRRGPACTSGCAARGVGMLLGRILRSGCHRSWTLRDDLQQRRSLQWTPDPCCPLLIIAVRLMVGLQCWHQKRALQGRLPSQPVRRRD